MNSKQNLVVGALVVWTAEKRYGVITEIDDRLIRVRWDVSEGAHNAPTQFSTSGPPLQRVPLTGEQVRRCSTGEEGVALHEVAAATPTWSCRIITKTRITTSNVPEADLRPLPSDVIKRFQSCEIGTMEKYRLREVTQWYRVQHLHDDLVSLGQIRVDIKPYQVSVVHKVISNYPHRFLLCDEVGLGKTIEAGMILKELRSRGAAQRVLVIVPPNLIGQWRFEMKSKFNERLSVMNADTVRYLRNNGYKGNPFSHPEYPNVLCSSSWVARKEMARFCAEVDWDLIIVDEAHHVRCHPNRRMTRLYRLMREISLSESITRRGMLFLTATPLQMHPHELYSLVELLDPILFSSPADFEKHRHEMPYLSKLVESLKEHGFPLPGENPDETVRQVAKWLDMEHSEARQRLDAGKNDKHKLEVLLEDLGNKHRLSEVLIRNRKNVIGGFMKRSASQWEVELTSEERVALQSVEEYVQYGYGFATSGNAIGLVMVTFQKLMASSIAAIKISLKKRRQVIQKRIAKQQSADDLQYRLDNDENVSDVIQSAGRASNMPAEEELRWVDNAISTLDKVKEDSKTRKLVDQLAKLFHDQENEKVIIFTQFRETQRHLKEQLVSKGWSVNLFHGQLSPNEKDDAIDRFKHGTGSQILISTEAGGEGRNLQFCHVLVNYDLPWNPMRVEQRIGRVDRIGQDSPISIFNMWTKGTVEERVLEILGKRINIFESTVGGLDPILGEIEGDIRKAMRLAEGQRDAALNRIGKQVDDKIREARNAEKLLRGNFIMDTKSYRREIAERITGQTSPVSNEDMEQFIGKLLDEVNTYIKSVGEVYELTFHSPFYDPQRKPNLFAGGAKRRAVFRPDRMQDAEDIEFMAFGHNIIDAIVEDVLHEEYEGATGTRRLLTRDGLSPVTGWLFTYQFTTSGARPSETLMPVFVSDSNEIDTELGNLLVQRALRFDDTESNINCDEINGDLEMANNTASHYASEQKEKIQKHAQNNAEQRVDQEISKINALYDYKECGARNKAVDTRQILNRLRASDEKSDRRILPAWEANLLNAEKLSAILPEERHRRIAEAEKGRFPQVDWALKSLGRIEIVDPQ